MTETISARQQVNRDERNAVDKAMALLSAFGDEASTGVGVTELARRTGLSKSTAFRILTVLQRNGAVERAGSAYRIGRRMVLLGEPAEEQEHQVVRDVLTPFLADLYELSHQTVHLAVLRGSTVVYLNKLHGHVAVRSPSRIGGTVPAYCTAVGKVLLAYEPDAVDAVLAEPLTPWTATTIRSRRQLLQELEQIRRVNLAFDRGEILDGLTCIAAPVLGPEGTPVAAMSVSGPAGSFVPERWANALRRVCFPASRALAKARRPVPGPQVALHRL